MATTTSENVQVPAVDLALLRDDQVVITTLRRIATELRRRGLGSMSNDADAVWETTLGVFTAGKPVRRVDLEQDLDRETIDHLVDVGAVVAHGEYLLPAIGLAFAGGVPVVKVVHQANHADMVYIGCEAPWLIRLAYRHGPGAGRAADLATGTGIVAVALSARYEHVVAADLLPAAVDCAALTLAVNRAPASETRAVVADVARGLDGPFDLIVANCPWVPTDPAPENNFVYGDGGPTGIELPTRFARESADLLAPGGVGIVLVLDTRWEDGSRPIESLLDELSGRGLSVVTEPAPPTAWRDEDSEACRLTYPGCLEAHLVAVVFSRPVSAE